MQIQKISRRVFSIGALTGVLFGYEILSPRDAKACSCSAAKFFSLAGSGFLLAESLDKYLGAQYPETDLEHPRNGEMDISLYGDNDSLARVGLPRVRITIPNKTENFAVERLDIHLASQINVIKGDQLRENYIGATDVSIKAKKIFSMAQRVPCFSRVAVFNLVSEAVSEISVSARVLTGQPYRVVAVIVGRDRKTRHQKVFIKTSAVQDISSCSGNYFVENRIDSFTDFGDCP